MEAALTVLVVVGTVSAALAAAGRIGWTDTALVVAATVALAVAVEAAKERTGYTTMTVLHEEDQP